MEKQLDLIIKLARDAVENYVNDGEIIEPEEITADMKGRAGVFVSIKKHGQLRGCIGTFEPTRATIADEIIANAINSATHDPRFTPVQASELPDLIYSVDILTPPEPVNDSKQLDPKKYGVINPVQPCILPGIINRFFRNISTEDL